MSTQILTPLLTYRFRVLYDSDFLPPDLLRQLTDETAICKFDLKNYKVNFRIRHGTVINMMSVALTICEQGLKSVILELLDDQNLVTKRVIMKNIEVAAHSTTTFDYTDNGCVMHDFECKFNSIDIVSP